MPRTEAPPPDASQGRLSGEPGSGSGAAASAGGSQGTAPGQAAGGPRPLRVLAAELFEEGAFVQECQEVGGGAYSHPFYCLKFRMLTSLTFIQRRTFSSLLFS